jgi:hypothetical protein
MRETANTLQCSGGEMCLTMVRRLSVLNAFQLNNIFNLQWIYWDVSILFSFRNQYNIKEAIVNTMELIK